MLISFRNTFQTPCLFELLQTRSALLSLRFSARMRGDSHVALLDIIIFLVGAEWKRVAITCCIFCFTESQIYGLYCHTHTLDFYLHNTVTVGLHFKDNCGVGQ